MVPIINNSATSFQKKDQPKTSCEKRTSTVPTVKDNRTRRPTGTSFMVDATDKIPSLKYWNNVFGFMDSMTCRPMVKTGFKDVMGSWKIMAISRPRYLPIFWYNLSLKSV